MTDTYDAEVAKALSLGREGLAEDDPTLHEMRLNRRVNASKTGAAGGVANVDFASMRPRDPMFYWEQNNLPYRIDQPEQLKKIRDFARLLYMTHPVIGPCIDIYSKYPLTGLEITSKDPKITEFYTDHFFGDDLDYEEFLIDVGREYWTAGEIFALGSFNETMGIWDSDELINPDDVKVINSPFLKEPRFEMRLPANIRQIIQQREPEYEFQQLMTYYPELAQLANIDGDEAYLPVSNTLMAHMRFKGNVFSQRGVPLLMRAFRSVAQEERLNAAQDAVADRLYTPLVLAKLGASASDLGTQTPWIPTQGDLDAFESALDAALAADFRIMTHHFAVDIQSVFGRETMPRLDSDFDRLEERQLQVFGLSKTMLSGAGGGETYAADALNRDLVTQLLSSYQRNLKRFFRRRAAVVAEAQEHWDYERRGDKRYPIMEEVLVTDPDTGEQRIEERPKLLIPDLQIKAMNMQDDASLRQLMEALRAQGVPISMDTRLVNLPIDLEEEAEKVMQEQVDQAVQAQEVRKRTYLQLKAQGLPIPADLRQDFEPHAGQTSEGASEDPQVFEAPPRLGSDDLVDNTALVPDELTDTDPDAAKAAEGEFGEGAPAAAERLPRNKARPPESDEMRGSMPKASSLIEGPSHLGHRFEVVLDPEEPLEDVFS